MRQNHAVTNFEAQRELPMGLDYDAESGGKYVMVEH